MNTEKMKEVFSDEVFVKSLLELETAAEVQAALKEKGVEMTKEEILAIRELLVKVESGEVTQEQLEAWQHQAEDGELSDEALEQVAGGLGFTALFAVAYALAGVSSLGTLSGFAWLMDSVIVDRTGRHW